MVREWIDEFWNDLRHGVVVLLRNVRFTPAAVLALALGIGANTAIFSVVNAVLIKPLPYPNPNRLALVTTVLGEDEVTGGGDYLHWKEESKTFESITAFDAGPLTVIDARGRPERTSLVRATSDIFATLGVSPQIGRAFTVEEDRAGGPPVAILGYSFWQQAFGGNPGIIGQSLELGRGQDSYTVIGIMPPGFRFIQDGSYLGEVQVLVPLGLDVQRELYGASRIIGGVIGRLKSRVTIEQASADLYAIEHNMELAQPERPHFPIRVVPLGERLVGHLRRGLLVLFGAVSFVFLIACTNVANLMLALGAMRQKEMAIRAALGAGRQRLVRQLFTESLVLAVFGGIAGLLLAILGVNALVKLAPDSLIQLKDSNIDGRVLGFAFLISLLTSLVAGVIPALQTSRVDLNTSLKDGASKSGASKRRGPPHAVPALVIVELALTLVLLVGAGLLIKSFVRLRAVNPGYNPENLLTMMTSLDPDKYPNGSPQQRLAYRDLLEGIKSIPGVKGVATGSSLPMTEGLDTYPLEVEGRPPVPEPQKPLVQHGVVSPDYFRVMEMQIRAGRGFTEQDDENGPKVVVINETMAQQHFAGESPLGKRILSGSPKQSWCTIIGVVADVKRYGLGQEVRSEFYVPSLQDRELGFMKLAIRTAGSPTDLAGAVRQRIWALDRNQGIWDVMSMEQRLDRSVSPGRFQMLLFGVLAALAFVLAIVGIYGVISNSVGNRTREIGIRMALGATPRSVLAMVIRQAMVLALVGVTIGLVAALALTRLMEGLLFSVKSTDPVTFAGISTLLLSVAFFAAYLPARRAVKVDPVALLRHE